MRAFPGSRGPITILHLRTEACHTVHVYQHIFAYLLTFQVFHQEFITPVTVQKNIVKKSHNRLVTSKKKVVP